MANDETIPEGLARLLQLFATDLAKVRFGDLDASVLDGAATVVRAAARELAEAEALADSARASLEAAQEALLHKGQRALAHARIHAEGSPELAARLESIALDGGLRRGEPKLITPDVVEASPRRRGRPPRSAPATGTLALETEPPSPSNGAPPHPPAPRPTRPEGLRMSPPSPADHPVRHGENSDLVTRSLGWFGRCARLRCLPRRSNTFWRGVTTAWPFAEAC